MKLEALGRAATFIRVPDVLSSTGSVLFRARARLSKKKRAKDIDMEPQRERAAPLALVVDDDRF